MGLEPRTAEQETGPLPTRPVSPNNSTPVKVELTTCPFKLSTGNIEVIMMMFNSVVSKDVCSIGPNLPSLSLVRLSVSVGLGAVSDRPIFTVRQIDK